MVLTLKEASFEALDTVVDALNKYVDDYNKGDQSMPDPAIAAICQNRLDTMPLVNEIERESGKFSFKETTGALNYLLKPTSIFSKFQFLKYKNFMAHKFFDDAHVALRCFQEGLQNLKFEASNGDEPLPEMVQYGLLAMAGVFFEMGCKDNTQQALREAIQAAQEAGDSSCLSLCLFWMAQMDLRYGKTKAAYGQLQRCLQRGAHLHLSNLQMHCCLNLAEAICISPTLANSKITADNNTSNPVGEDTGMPMAGGVNVTTAASNIAGGAQPSALSQLLKLSPTTTTIEEGPELPSRKALAYTILAGHLSAAQRASGADVSPTTSCDTTLRSRVLLGQIEVARQFGLHPIQEALTRVLLTRHRPQLGTDELSLGMGQLSNLLSRKASKKVKPLLRGLATTLPHAENQWFPRTAKQLTDECLRKHEFQTVKLLLQRRAAIMSLNRQPDEHHSTLHDINKLRMLRGDLVTAFDEVQAILDLLEQNKSYPATASDIVRYLLLKIDIRLEAGDPAGCIPDATVALRYARQNGLGPDLLGQCDLRMAQLKYEFGEIKTALQIIDDLKSRMSNKHIKGKTLLLEAEIIIACASFRVSEIEDGDNIPGLSNPGVYGEEDPNQILKEAIPRLQQSLDYFLDVDDLLLIEKSSLLLAKAHNQLADIPSRNKASDIYRKTHHQRMLNKYSHPNPNIFDEIEKTKPTPAQSQPNLLSFAPKPRTKLPPTTLDPIMEDAIPGTPAK